MSQFARLFPRATVVCAALATLLLCIAPAMAQTKLTGVITSLFGKTRAEVEARAGKGKPAEYGSVAYKYPGVRSINVEYAPADYGDPELNGKVLSITIKFLKPLQESPDNWKGALRLAGFPTEGVILGDAASNSADYFKNVKGIPKGFIGYVGFKDKQSLHFTHWSYLTLSMGAWSRPK